MLLDLNDAQSIVDWWSVFPTRHGSLLSDWARRRPEHRAAIAEARRIIGADPGRRVLLERSRDSAADASGLAGDAPLSHDELAAGELAH